MFLKPLIGLVFLLPQWAMAQQLDTAYGLTLLHHFNFDNPQTNQLLEIEGNCWSIGKPAKNGFDSAYSSPNALVTDTESVYPNNSEGFVSFKIQKSMNILVSFMHRFDTDTLHDGGMIEISYDLGNSWNNIAINPYAKEYWIMRWHSAENMYDSTMKLFNGMPGFSGNSNGWITSSFKLVWLVKMFNSLDSVMLRFRFISDSISNHRNGWMIDDIKVWYVEMGGGFDEFSNDHNIQLYPNPSTGNFFASLKGTANHITGFKCKNTAGQLILEQTGLNQTECSFNLSNVESGLYFLTLFDENHRPYYRKFILNR